MLKVRQFYNKNQFIIIDNKKDEVWFQSYESTIAKVDNENKLTLFENWDYSNTTRKHLYLFINSYCSYRFACELNEAKNKRQFILKAIRDGVVKIGKVNKTN